MLTTVSDIFKQVHNIIHIYLQIKEKQRKVTLSFMFNQFSNNFYICRDTYFYRVLLKLVWNNKTVKPGINGLFITKLNYSLLLIYYPFLYSYLLIKYLLIFWHIKAADILKLIYDKLIAMLLLYHFFVKKETFNFQLLPMQAFQYN